MSVRDGNAKIDTGLLDEGERIQLALNLRAAADSLSPISIRDNDDIVAEAIRNVCELEGYTSPDDQPELLQCTTGELDLCIRRALGEDV
jgi:hypothetical protein